YEVFFRHPTERSPLRDRPYRPDPAFIRSASRPKALLFYSSSRMRTSSCHPLIRERNPFGFLPYSANPTLLYRARAF
ncbi:MAG: hypothetical protein IIT62_05715, partial [Oscillospiraceae bacterium]|nr:hypothetical protein [Oscillospiraceae bacterium]